MKKDKEIIIPLTPKETEVLIAVGEKQPFYMSEEAAEAVVSLVGIGLIKSNINGQRLTRKGQLYWNMAVK